MATKLHLLTFAEQYRQRQQRRTNLRLLFIAIYCLLIGFLAGVVSAARAAEWHLVLHGASHHTGQRTEPQTTLQPVDTCTRTDKRRTCSTTLQPVTRDVVVPYQEQNWGGGVRAQLAPAWSVQAGAYRNSYDRTSAYLLGEWLPLRAGMFSAGLFGGIASGYDHGIAAAGFVGRMQIERLSVTLRYLPDMTEKQSGSTTALELGWRV